ncbi:MAG: hypothetical protein WAO78_15240, partial [Roseovarius sp.]
AGCWSLAAGCWLLVAGCWPLEQEQRQGQEQEQKQKQKQGQEQGQEQEQKQEQKQEQEQGQEQELGSFRSSSCLASPRLALRCFSPAQLASHSPSSPTISSGLTSWLALPCLSMRNTIKNCCHEGRVRAQN